MLSNMLKHRSASGVTVLDGEIYACGGHDGLSIFDSVSLPLTVVQMILRFTFGLLTVSGVTFLDRKFKPGVVSYRFLQYFNLFM